MTPIANPASPAEERYNRSHIRTRVVVEQTFGTLKSRFRCIHQSGGALQYEPDKCVKVAVCCMLLHNYCIERNIPLMDNIDDDEQQNDDVRVVNVGNGEAARNALVHGVFTN